MRVGVTEAVIALTGRLTAFAVMLALAAAGLAAVLTRSQTVFELVKWAGVAYLAYLGFRSLVALIGHRLEVADFSERARRLLDQAFGGVFLLLAGLLATTKR